MAPGIKLTEYYVKQELRNLNMEDAHRRHIAMNALTKHVQLLDGNEVPNFLKQVSQALHKSKPTSISCHLNAISLYEKAVRRHGASLVCQLGIIICMLRTALNLVGFNTALQQACVKLVRSIANYVICTSENREQRLIEEVKDPASLHHHDVHSCGDSGPQMNSLQKTHVVYCQQILKDLCSPLLEKVGEAPRCLHALVETPAWKFASQDLVNQACLQATRGLLIKGSQAVGHMQLICSLAKKNGLALKPHVGTLLKAVAEIFDKGSVHNWQQRLCSVEMINGFVKISSGFELLEIIGVLERQREDKMPCVRKVVLETIHRAKLVLENQCFQVEERICNSVVLSCSSEESTGSNELDGIEGYGDSDVKPVSGFSSEWSVRENPIAGDEIQGNLIVPVYTNGKDILVDLKGEIIVEGLRLLWGSENYLGRRQGYMQEKCCGESSEVERSEEISSVSSVNMDCIECEKMLKKEESCFTDLEDGEEQEKLSMDGNAEAELEGVLRTGNREKMIKEDKISCSDFKNTEEHEILSINGQLEAELEDVVPSGNCDKFINEDESCYTDLGDAARHANLSSNGGAEAELEEVVPVDKISYTYMGDTERHDKLSRNGKAEAELEEVVPIGNCEEKIKEDQERHGNLSRNGEAETELEEVPIGKRLEKLSSNGHAEARLEEQVPIRNCEKVIKEDPERHENLSSNGEAETKLEEVPIGKNNEKLSRNGKAEAKLEEHVPIGNCEKMIKEDREKHEKLSSEAEVEFGEVVAIANCEKWIKEDAERHEKLSSKGEAETELEEVPTGKSHEKLSSNGQVEAELEEQVQIGNCEKLIKEDPERHEKMSSEAEAELEEVVAIGNREKMIKEDPERHEKMSSNGKTEAELAKQVPIGNCEKVIKEDLEWHENLSSNSKAETELEEVPIGKRQEKLSSNDQAEAKFEEQEPTGNCEKIIKEDPEKHEKLSSEAEAGLKEVVPFENCEKLIKEDTERHEKLSSNGKADAEWEEVVPIGMWHEKLSSNGQAEAELEEQVPFGNCEKMLREDPERHEKLSSKAEAELKEVVPMGNRGKVIKEEAERYQKLASNGKAEAESEEQVPIGNCEKMIKEDLERHEKLSGVAEAGLKEVVPFGNCEKMIKEDAERHEKLSSNGKADAECEEVVPIGNYDKMIKEDTERHESLSTSGEPEEEFEEAPIGNCKELIKEDGEMHDNLSSNGQAEVEFEENLPIGNYEKMIEEKSSAYRWSMKMGQISLSSVLSRWRKAAERVELILGISLCAGLIVSAAMFSIKSFLIHEDNHVLVPT